MAYNSGVKHLLQEALLWGVVAAIGFSGVYYFDNLRTFTSTTIEKIVATTEVAVDEITSRPRKKTSGFERSVIIKANRRGHFYTRAYINGRPIAVLVDTGATNVALSYEDAERLGIRPHSSDFTLKARTANGIARAAPIKIDSLRIGDVEVTDLRGSIAEPGKQHITLLGMEFIRKLERFELRGRELILVE